MFLQCLNFFRQHGQSMIVVAQVLQLTVGVQDRFKSILQRLDLAEQQVLVDHEIPFFLGDLLQVAQLQLQERQFVLQNALAIHRKLQAVVQNVELPARNVRTRFHLLILHRSVGQTAVRMVELKQCVDAAVHIRRILVGRLGHFNAELNDIVRKDLVIIRLFESDAETIAIHEGTV